MKIRFNADLDYQRDAVASCVDIFAGQGVANQSGANHLKLRNEDILVNVNKIQTRNGLTPIEELDGMNFTVEMETGTGKTYVYLRTIFELHRKYGFAKYVIVVPSIAIKEGVLKSLQITREHFRRLYGNVRYEYFVYNSYTPHQLKDFADSDCIQIMVVNIDAFNKKSNILHRGDHESGPDGGPLLQYIQVTNPIVIIDEPQSVDTTDKGRNAIALLNPLCTLRYSATHKDHYNQMFRLNAVDAYERKLVKQIEVAGIDVEGNHNRAYVKLIKVDNKKSPITAQVEIDIQSRGGKVQRKKKKVRAGDDLFVVSGGRDVYDDYIIEDIYCEKGCEYISFTSKSDIVKLGEAIGEVSQDDYKRLQICKTIEEHLNKELRLRSRGIKVLSLFFIDRVANYRDYDGNGNPRPGKYAIWFEEEYAKLIRKPEYADLFKSVDIETAAEGVHGGYFAIDKKKDTNGAARLKDSRGEGTTIADEGAYQLIMRDKEKLLNFNSKLRFIFTHSALKEGWDNPNVFQICTLNETSSVMKKRQEIGRGLRIAINQDGERVHGFDVNTLTVVTNGSYEDFVKNLQKEIEEDIGIRFGIIEKRLFANILIETDDHTIKRLGVEASEMLWDRLKGTGYIDAYGKVLDRLRNDLKFGQIQLPMEFRKHGNAIRDVLKKIVSGIYIRKANTRDCMESHESRLSIEFQEIWDQIQNVTFQVMFDPEKLIQECAKEIKHSLVVTPARFIFRKDRIGIDRSGGVQMEKMVETRICPPTEFALPDVVSCLQDETNLTRRSIVEILCLSGKLDCFKYNPQSFIDQAKAIIQHKMSLCTADGIKYRRTNDARYVQELFDIKDDTYLTDPAGHQIYNLPGWFKIETPLGSYNPDCAIFSESQLYFTVKSKLKRWGLS